MRGSAGIILKYQCFHYVPVHEWGQSLGQFMHRIGVMMEFLNDVMARL